jgi:hypothetical protein
MLADVDEAVGIRESERVQNSSLDHREDRSAHANSDGKHSHGGEGEARTLAKSSAGTSQAVPNGCNVQAADQNQCR